MILFANALREHGNCNLGAGNTKKKCEKEQGATKNLKMEQGARETIKELEEKSKGNREQRAKSYEKEQGPKNRRSREHGLKR